MDTTNEPMIVSSEDSIVPVYLVPPTQSELDFVAEQNARLEQQQMEQLSKLESIKNKLKALGLTDSEIDLLVK